MCLTMGSSVIIHPNHQTQILNELHRDHPGCARKKSVAKSFVWWPQMDMDIENNDVIIIILNIIS